jgi:WD40 repeat protein
MSTNRLVGGSKGRLLLLGALLCVMGFASRPKRKLEVRELPAIAVRGCSLSSMEDAADGLLLLECREGGHEHELFIWDMSRGTVSKQIAATWFSDAKSGMPSSFSVVEPGPLRLLGAGNEIVAGAGCHVIALAADRERHLDLPADICDENSPFLSHLRYSPWDTISVNRQRSGFALAFNVGSKPRLLLFRRDSQHPYAERDLPRYVNDVAWSPDARHVAVLYSGYADKDLRWVASVPGARVTLPDISVFDAQTADEELSFFSGGPESKLEYAPDGRLIYCISQNRFLGYSWGDWNKETLKAFSVTDGTLVRTIRLPRNGVRNSFALSPHGKFIAADSSTDLFRVLQEPDFVHKMGRFVVLNAESGDSLFEYHASMDGKITAPIRFAFSPDGRLLFVDFNREGVVSYSVD